MRIGLLVRSPKVQIFIAKKGTYSTNRTKICCKHTVDTCVMHTRRWSVWGRLEDTSFCFHSFELTACFSALALLLCVPLPLRPSTAVWLRRCHSATFAGRLPLHQPGFFFFLQVPLNSSKRPLPTASEISDVL